MSDTPEILHQLNYLKAIHNSRVSVGLTGNQSVNSGGGLTRLQLNNEEIDKLGEWDSTNYEFTPLVAGDYDILACASIITVNDQTQFTFNLYDDAVLIHQSLNAASGSYYISQCIAIKKTLTTVSKINIQVHHNHGVARDISAIGTRISIQRVG